jgi:hypothetical protein
MPAVLVVSSEPLVVCVPCGFVHFSICFCLGGGGCGSKTLFLSYGMRRNAKRFAVFFFRLTDPSYFVVVDRPIFFLCLVFLKTGRVSPTNPRRKGIVQ